MNVEKPSKPHVDPKLVPTKRVVFECVGGVWKGSVDSAGPEHPFTIKDWNQLQKLLTVKQSTMRQQAYVLYRRQQQEQNRKAREATVETTKGN